MAYDEMLCDRNNTCLSQTLQGKVWERHEKRSLRKAFHSTCM